MSKPALQAHDMDSVDIALAKDPKLAVYEVVARHEVYVTYEVAAKDHDDAVQRLCGVEIWDEYGYEYCKRFGVNEFAAANAGARVTKTMSYPDPSPTGRQRVERDWEVEEVEE